MHLNPRLLLLTISKLLCQQLCHDRYRHLLLESLIFAGHRQSCCLHVARLQASIAACQGPLADQPSTCYPLWLQDASCPAYLGLLQEMRNHGGRGHPFQRPYCSLEARAHPLGGQLLRALLSSQTLSGGRHIHSRKSRHVLTGKLDTSSSNSVSSTCLYLGRARGMSACKPCNGSLVIQLKNRKCKVRASIIEILHL